MNDVQFCRVEILYETRRLSPREKSAYRTNGYIWQPERGDSDFRRGAR